MTIAEWQKAFKEGANHKFGQSWSDDQRLLSILRQLGDLSGAVQKENKELVTDNVNHTGGVGHRIACLLIDVFILAEDNNIDLEPELEQVLDWFYKEKE